MHKKVDPFRTNVTVYFNTIKKMGMGKNWLRNTNHMLKKTLNAVRTLIQPIPIWEITLMQKILFVGNEQESSEIKFQTF